MPGSEYYDEDGQDFLSEKPSEKKNTSRELELYTMRELMRTENGRAFMWRCLQNCGTFDNMFNIEPVQHAFNAGKRDHGLWLARELREAAIDDYYKMLKEHEDE